MLSKIKINVLLVCGLLLAGFLFQNFYAKKENNFASRNDFAKAMEFIKVERPTPPESAIFYAKVAEDIYNKKPINFSEEYFKNVLDDVKKDEEALTKVKLKSGNTWNEYWVGENPFSPNISKYKRFLLKEFSYQVPPPPVYKGVEFYKDLAAVSEASETRTSQQSALVNFYGGVPGTEQPAGIWQNILWENSKFDKSLSDRDYAKMQLLLAQTIADAFMECWKVKYTYQTKRPNMTDDTIDVAMPNPPFPGYVSGHATISYAAANILSYLHPNKKDIWLNHALQAKNSRLWAGIHFAYDNEEGQKLGEEVAKNIISRLEN